MIPARAPSPSPSSPVVPPTDDTRATARSTLVCKALLYSDAGDGPTRVFVSNISLTGIGLRLVRPVMPGSEHRLTLEAGPMSLRTRVRVVHCSRKDDRSWEAGFSFVRADLATETARDIGASATTGNIPARLKASVPRNPTRMLTPR